MPGKEGICNVLIVCTGNSCRSPMAEGLLRNLLPDDSSIRVSSAGTMPPQNRPPTDYAVMTMLERGVDIRPHRSRPLTKEMVKQADLILVMEHAHRRFIISQIPEAEDRIFLLSEYGLNKGKEIDDPVGQDLNRYRQIADIIEREIRRILPLIQRAAGTLRKV